MISAILIIVCIEITEFPKVESWFRQRRAPNGCAVMDTHYLIISNGIGLELGWGRALILAYILNRTLRFVL